MSSDALASSIGVALIGAGMIASRHISALSNIQSRAQLRVVVSRNPGKAKSLAKYYDGVPPIFSDDLSEVLENPDILIVIVATPPSVRIDLIRALAEAGKHILLEKPVARNFSEALQVVEICEQAGSTLGMLFQHQLRATTLEAKRLLSSGVLGRLSLIQIDVPIWREQSYYDELERGTYDRDGGGVMITQAIHTMNLALTLAGPVSYVQAMTATTLQHQMEAEDFAIAGLRFESGAVGSLVASTAIFPHGTETITLHCEHASAVLSAERLEISWKEGRRDIFPENLNERHEGSDSTPKHVWHQAIVENFIDALSTNVNPVVSGRQALMSHSLIEAIEKSSENGKSINMLDWNKLRFL